MVGGYERKIKRACTAVENGKFTTSDLTMMLRFSPPNYIRGVIESGVDIHDNIYTWRAIIDYDDVKLFKVLTDYEPTDDKGIDITDARDYALRTKRGKWAQRFRDLVAESDGSYYFEY